MLRSLLLGALVMSAGRVQAQALPRPYPPWVEGYEWMTSPRLGIQILRPLGWAFQEDFEPGGSQPGLYITPFGISPGSPRGRFEIFGGIRIERLGAIPPTSRSASFRGYLEEKRKWVRKRFEGEERWGIKHSRFRIGTAEGYRFDTSHVPGTRFIDVKVFKRIEAYVFNEEPLYGFHIEALVAMDQAEEHLAMIEKVLHSLRPPLGP